MTEKRFLDDFVKMSDPQAVCLEALRLLRLISPSADLRRIQGTFEDVGELFAGRRPGYRACNTEYHDLQHTTDTLLAMVRLMHGAAAEGARFSDAELAAAALAAMLHDSGYIQESSDREGTGAKYTSCHVDRSIVFMRRYCAEKLMDKRFATATAHIMMCTGLHVAIEDVPFESANAELLGRMLGAGDLLGQMSDRCYLEKLLFLFYEFQEGKIPGFADEYDLLTKTIGFYDVTRRRLAEELGGVDRFMRAHFKARWGLDRDYYAETIERNIGFLRDKVVGRKGDFRALLRRGGLVEKLKKIKGETK